MNFNFFTRFINISKTLIKEFLDLIYKRKCIECGCSINKHVLCKTCLKTVQNLSCFPQQIINGYRVYSVFYYEGVIKTLIHKLKFKHNKACAYYAAGFLYDYIKQIKNENFNNAVIIPIVTHKNNFKSRGYDNVLEITKELSKLTGFRLDCNSLKKIKYTEPQYKLNAKQRTKNLEGSFSLNKNFNHGGLVIIVDDIVTTGSTLCVVTNLFKERGINNLICLTLSKTK